MVETDERGVAARARRIDADRRPRPATVQRGRNRLSTAVEDVDRLRHVDELTGLGVNYEGVRRILALEAEVAGLAVQLRHVLRQTYAASRADARAPDAAPLALRPRGEIEKWRPA